MADYDPKNPIDPKDPSVIKQLIQRQELERMRAEATDKLQAGYSIRAKERAAGREEKEHKKEKAWHALEEASKKLIEEGMKGYDTYISAMLGIVHNCNLFVDADVMGSLTASALTMVRASHEGLKDLSIAGVIDKIKTAKGAPMPSIREVKLPDLQHNIKFNDKNVLDIDFDSLRRSDGKLFDDAYFEDKNMPPGAHQNILRSALKNGVHVWLEQLGYEAKKDGTFVSKKDKTTILTQTQFETLRRDPTNGLDAFLSGRFEMNIEYAPPRP